MTRRSMRKLVSLTPELAAAVAKFRDAPELTQPCPRCGHISVTLRDGRASESDVMRHLISLALDARDAKTAPPGEGGTDG